MKKTVFIIGLGRFGQSLALMLHEAGYDVTISDIDEQLVKNFGAANPYFYQMILNSTNMEVLKSTAITLVDYVVVAISKIEDSVLTCVNLRDLGIKSIYAKAQNKTHARLLKSIGVANIIFPEEYAAKFIFNKIINEELDIIKQGENGCILKVRVTNDKAIGHTIGEFTTDDFNIFAVLRNEPNALIKYSVSDLPIKKLDTIYIMCSNDKLK